MIATLHARAMAALIPAILMLAGSGSSMAQTGSPVCEDILDQSQTMQTGASFGGVGGGVSQDSLEAQTFKAGVSGPLKRISLLLRKRKGPFDGSEPGPLMLEIRSTQLGLTCPYAQGVPPNCTSGGVRTSLLPSAAVLASSVLTPTQIDDSAYQWYNVDLPAAPVLSAGETYAVVAYALPSSQSSACPGPIGYCPPGFYEWGMYLDQSPVVDAYRDGEELYRAPGTGNVWASSPGNPSGNAWPQDLAFATCSSSAFNRVPFMVSDVTNISYSTGFNNGSFGVVSNCGTGQWDYCYLGYVNALGTYYDGDVLPMPIPMLIRTYGQFSVDYWIVDTAQGRTRACVPPKPDFNDRYSLAFYYIADDGSSYFARSDHAGNLPPDMSASEAISPLHLAQVCPQTVSASAGLDQTVNEGTQVTLNGSSSSAETASYIWEQVAGPQVALSDVSLPTPTFSAPFIDNNVTLTFQLTVTGQNGATDKDTVDISVVNVNSPPVADAGNDSTVKVGAIATLNGIGSYDPDGHDIVSYFWAQVGGPAVTLISDPPASPAMPRFIPRFGDVGTLMFKLRVCDSSECSVSSQGADPAQGDTVAITIVPNSAPVSVAGLDQTRDEGSTVTLDGSASYDPDGGDILSYSWNQIGGTAVALSGASAAAATFSAPAVPAGGTILEFELTVTDNDAVNLKSSTDRIAVRVRNVNDPPTCHLATAVPASVWPPNHKMVPVSINGVMDSDSVYNRVSLRIGGVNQDEPVNGLGDGDSSPDAMLQPGNDSAPVLVRAERSGNGNGRVYTIQFVADDGFESCSGSVKVSVPQSRNGPAIDDGGSHDATAQ